MVCQLTQKSIKSRIHFLSPKYSSHITEDKLLELIMASDEN